MHKKTMTEKEKLEGYIKEGFKTHMIIRDVAQKEKKARLPESWWDKEVYALPLWREDNKKLMFYFVEEETKEYARLLVKKGKEVIGYDNPFVRIRVLSKEEADGCTVCLEDVIKSLGKIKGWDARLSDYPNLFIIPLKIDSGDKQKIKDILKEIEEVLLLLSLKNKKGFKVESYSLGERYRDQPFSMIVGRMETSLKGLSSKDLVTYSKKWRSHKFIEAINALRLIYTQINKLAKITFSWVALEDFFGQGRPKHLLSKGEIKKISEAINNTELTGDKKTFVVERLKNSSLFSKITRNERIAEGVAELLAEDYEDILKQIRRMAVCRGKLVHAINTEDIDIREHIEFTEKVLLAYLDKA